jgi:hypothetical protein
MRTLLAGAILALATTVLFAADEFPLEPGYTLLFNGKSLDGWKTKTGGQSLDGKTEAYKGRFKVEDGVLTIDPSVKGDVRIMTARSFDGDVHIKFDFKPDAKCNNDLFLRGQKFDLVKSNVKNMKEGEWNEFEIVVAGDMIEFKNNGEKQRSAKVKPGGTFEIRAEFGSVQFRRMRAKVGP